jgi:two-component system, NtrC family, response regulator HydG
MADPFDDDVSTVAHQRFVPSPLPSAQFELRVVEGPDVGQTFLIDGSAASRSMLGTSPSCDLRLTDKSVSRRHAAFELVGDRLRVTDLESTNGIIVNGLLVVDAFMLGGETLHVGATSLCATKLPAEGRKPPPDMMRFGRMVGVSHEMRRLYPLCAKLAASDVSVVIEGETGTGKEVLAESLHEMGRFADGPYVVFDCTAVPPSLVESELFGHERGAFTGAVAQRKGVFEQAHNGTLLIDEIGDLDIALQAKLLRAVERGEIRRVGGDKPIQVTVRLLAATRRDLEHEVQVGRFRDDLLHRIAVARIELPPLRRRRGDIPLLVNHFCKLLGADANLVPAALLARWNDYEWPGNVRELRNAVARFIALGDFESEGAEGDARLPVQPDTGDFIAEVLAEQLPIERARRKVLEHFERRYIAQVLGVHGGNVARAATASGIARRHFNRLRARSK